MLQHNIKGLEEKKFTNDRLRLHFSKYGNETMLKCSRKNEIMLRN